MKPDQDEVIVPESPSQRPSTEVDTIESVVITNPRVDPSHFILAGIDTSKEPRFAIGEVAKFFFARSAHWIRWVEREHRLVLDGKPVGVGRTGSGAREYTLTDVEEMAHALASNNTISGAQLSRALALVAMEAELWEYTS